MLEKPRNKWLLSRLFVILKRTGAPIWLALACFFPVDYGYILTALKHRIRLQFFVILFLQTTIEKANTMNFRIFCYVDQKGLKVNCPTLAVKTLQTSCEGLAGANLLSATFIV